MKKFFVILGCSTISVIIILFVLKTMILWQGIYTNNPVLNQRDNYEIKQLLLYAVKDRCSFLFDIDKEKIYSEDSKEYIIQFDEVTQSKKSLICLVDLNFMESLTVLESNEYAIIMKAYYPEDYYYHFKIRKTDDGFVIVSFELDT